VQRESVCNPSRRIALRLPNITLSPKSGHLKEILALFTSSHQFEALPVFQGVFSLGPAPNFYLLQMHRGMTSAANWEPTGSHAVIKDLKHLEVVLLLSGQPPQINR
jgi:hypothetical protein